MQVGDLSVSIEIVGDVDEIMTELRRATALGLKIRSAKLGVARGRSNRGIYISDIENGDGESARKSVVSVSQMISMETSARLAQLIDELERVTK